MSLSHYLHMDIATLLLNILSLMGAGVAIASLIHAVRMRAEAFTLDGKVSKLGWIVLLVISGLILLDSGLHYSSRTLFLAIIAWVVVGVYYGSRRHELDEIMSNASS